MRDLGNLALSVSRKLSTSETWEELAETFSIHIQDLGLTCAASGMVTGPRASAASPFHFMNWPADWQTLYAQENYLLIDPLPRYALTSGAPASWTDIMVTLTRNDPGHKVYAAAVLYGFSEGMVIPLRNATGDLGLVTIGGSRSKLQADEVTFLTMISSTAFHTAESLQPSSQRRDKLGVFTLREMDCISLLSNGLTDTQIAKVLGLSRETVISHMENARRKVSAKTRAHLLSIVMQSRFAQYSQGNISAHA